MGSCRMTPLFAFQTPAMASARERFLRVEPGVFKGFFPSLGGGGGRWRRRWRRRWGVCGAHLSGRNTSPRAWLPISWQYLGDLRNRSGGLAQRKRGVGGRRFVRMKPDLCARGHCV